MPLDTNLRFRDVLFCFDFLFPNADLRFFDMHFRPNFPFGALSPSLYPLMRLHLILCLNLLW
jgi:hypothetical protein